MGRKKNLEALKNRLAHVEREIKELQTYQAGDQYQVDEFLAEKEALEWILRELGAEPFGAGDRVTLKVSDDPEDGDQPVSGVILNVLPGDAYLVRPDEGQPFSDRELWYSKDEVAPWED